MAYGMITDYGMNDRVGPLSFSNDDNTLYKPFSEKTARLIDAEASKMVEHHYEKAVTMLAERKEQLTALAEAEAIQCSVGGASVGTASKASSSAGSAPNSRVSTPAASPIACPAEPDFEPRHLTMLPSPAAVQPFGGGRAVAMLSKGQPSPVTPPDDERKQPSPTAGMRARGPTLGRGGARGVRAVAAGPTAAASLDRRPSTSELSLISGDAEIS